jgi:hypothetical protein
MGPRLAYALREEYKFRVFENRVLTRIFGPKKEEVAGRWRRLHNGEELHNLYPSLNNIRGIKSMRIGWRCMQHACKRSKMHTIFRLVNMNGGDHSEDISVDRKIILEWFLGK